MSEAGANASLRGSLCRNCDAASLKCEAAWVAFGSIAFALFFTYPILSHLTHGGVPKFPLQDDWDYFMQLHWVTAQTILGFHQFPLWDPFKCGGMPLLANPQSAVLTPFLLLELLFGPATGLHLGIIGHAAIAFGGAYFLARGLGISPVGAVACATAFAGSSWYYLHAEIGHINFEACAYLPWAIALAILAVNRRWLTAAALAGIALALMVMEGGIHAVLQAIMVLCLLMSLIAIQRREGLPMVVLAVAGVFMFGL
ncbi:MAG TPA: hypothetical protein VMT58_01190, partial [Candidatus Binataceae bacterium]|nr:hypothetical protein [Candidatus Binataceae bacterium]